MLDTGSTHVATPVPQRRRDAGGAALGAVAMGFAGSVLVLAGSSQGRSPFAVKLPEAWFFGSGPGGPARLAGAAADQRIVGVALVYAGVLGLIGGWLLLIRRPQRLQRMRLMAAAWALPLIVAPPLFSRDVYSYVAQGQMLSQGLNPYRQGPQSLGSGPVLSLVDPLWRGVHAPYGPLFERLSQLVVTVSGHHPDVAAAGFRVLAIVGVGLIAWAVPSIAASTGRDPRTAFALAVMNPLILLILLGGAHNDALMLGLLCSGCALALRGHPLAGIVACSLAAEVKAPALISVLFIGWWAASSGSRRRPVQSAGFGRRALGALLALALAVLLIAAMSAVAGLGWGFVGTMVAPEKVVSWLDPATAVGLSLSHLASALGLGAHRGSLVDFARVVGICAAAAIGIRLLLRSDRERGPQALGWTLLALALLGPVVWPWYETWGLGLLGSAAVAGWRRRVLVGLSAIGCLADVPSAAYLVDGSTILVALVWSLLPLMVVGVLSIVVRRRSPHPQLL